MKAPRGHHYNPQFLLRKFTNQEGRLFVYDKRRPEAGVFETSPNNVFKERDLNALEKADGSLDHSLEHKYSQLEAAVAPVVEKLIEFAEFDKHNPLTPREKAVFDEFFYRQFARAPDAFDRPGITANFDADWKKAVAEVEEEVGQIPPSIKSELLSLNELPRLKKNAVVMARQGSPGKVVDLLAQSGLIVVATGTPKKSFITGDYPYVRTGPTGRSGPPKYKIWLPISHSAAVSPYSLAGFLNRAVLSRDEIRRLNEAIFKNSNLVAGRSRQLIQSLAKPH